MLKSHLKYEKIFLDKEISSIKSKKPNHNDVLFNAAAFQQQLDRELGVYKQPKRRFKRFKSEGLSAFLPKIVNNTLAKESEVSEVNRQKDFLKGLTLAERYGLKQLKRLPLTLEEWEAAEKLAISRDDYKGNCAICLSSLFLNSAVILSCSHVYHSVTK